MLVSYVLRLVPEELANGRLVGEVEAVASGERRAVHGAEELQAFCAEALTTVRRPGPVTKEG